MSFRESLSGFRKGFKRFVIKGKRKLGGKGPVPVEDGVDSLESGSQSVGASTRGQGASVVGEPVDSARPSASRDGPGPASAGETDKEGGGMDVYRSKVNTVQEPGLLSHVGASVGTGHSDEVRRAQPPSPSTPTPHIATPSETDVVPDNEPKGIRPERGASAVNEPIRPADQEQDMPAPATVGGSQAKQERGDSNAHGKAVKLQDPDPRSDAEPLAAGGRSEKVQQDHSFPPPTTIPHRTKSDDTATVTDPNKIHSDGNTQSNAADEKKLNWKSTMSSTAKLLLRGVRDSADAFGPLKSVAGGLCFILENCERTKANKQTIESLAPRVKALFGQLCKPGGDVEEVERRKKLQVKLEKVMQELEPLKEQGNVEGFFTSTENAEKLGGLVQDILDAVMDYQVSLQQGIYQQNCQLIGDVDLILLKSMHHTPGAGHNSGGRQGCLWGTRIDLLHQLEDWLEGIQSQNVFWLNGLAGTGKSTIAQTFADLAFAEGKLGASFFCSRDFENRSNLQAIFPTLAFQLAHQYPSFRQEVLKVLRANSGIGHETLWSQLEKLIVRPFKATKLSTLIIIDALDECKDDEPASAMLSVLSRYVNEIPNVKFFITGRPEPRIHSGFRLKSLKPITEVFKLHEVERLSVDSDIKLFFRTRLIAIAKTRWDCNFPQDWPDSSHLDILCKKAAGFFIYASTVVKFISSKSRIPTEQLNLVISIPNHTGQEGKGIDPLYTQVLEQAVDDVDADDKDKEEIHASFRSVVGAVLLVSNPLSKKTLSELLKVSKIPTILHSLYSLLLIPENEEDPIQIFHKSFSDFLTDPERCKSEWFFVDPAVYHTEILLSCLRLMKERLRKNICNLDDYATLSEVEDLSACAKENVGDALEYACHFWSKHLLQIPKDSSHVREVQNAINEFSTTSLLYWIEVLVVTKNLGGGVHAMNDVDQWCALAGVSCKWTNDTQRCLLQYFEIIQDSPSQIYTSTFSFSPPSSWFHSSYRAELSRVKVVKGLPTGWGTCTRTVAMDGYPYIISCWGTIAVVGLGSEKVTILDVITGNCTAVLSGHASSVKSLTLSADGTLLASGSLDKTVKLWDMQTGGIIKTFFGHKDTVQSVSISPDSTTIASGSKDKTIRLWNIQTGQCYHVIEQQYGVYFVGFPSMSSQQLICELRGRNAFLLSLSDQNIKQEYDGEHVALSSDGTQLALCKERAVAVQNVESGAIVAEFHANGYPRCCCISPDDRLVAVAVAETAYVWDICSADPHPIETFIGHTDDIRALAFSSPSCLISASYDKSVKFWQICTSSTEPVESGQKSTPSPSVEFESITLQVEDDITVTSDRDGVVRIWDISSGLCKTSFQTPAAGAEFSDCQLADGRLIIAWYAKWKIYIFDIEKQTLLQVDGPGGTVYQLRISGDGSKIICMDAIYLQFYSILTGKQLGKVNFSGHPSEVTWNIDGPKVWLCRSGSRFQGWDFGISGLEPIILSDPPSKSHPNGTMFWDPIQCRVNDVATGRVICQLPRRYGQTFNVQWKKQYLVLCFSSEDFLILNFGQ